jgi:uncharacterized protein YndB with AHSA1/START domain
MAKAENTIVINVPVEKVFAFVTDGLQAGKWRPSVTDVALAEGTAGTVGATYKQGLKGPSGRRIDGDYRIVDVVPNQTFSFEVIAGPAHPRGQYIFETAEGGTSVRFILSLETTGLQKLLDPIITSTMNKEVASLANLKTYLEANPV